MLGLTESRTPIRCEGQKSHPHSPCGTKISHTSAVRAEVSPTIGLDASKGSEAKPEESAKSEQSVAIRGSSRHRGIQAMEKITKIRGLDNIFCLCQNLMIKHDKKETAMLIRDIGGEFALIQRLSRIVPPCGAEVVVGIGDDAAVIRLHGETGGYLLITTDTLVSGDHFNTSWSRPEQIGIKAAECNVSDIAAMGGVPTYMFISLVLTSETTVEWVEGLYRGISESCRRHGVAVIGGDTTCGPAETVSITLLGSATHDALCLRSHATPGDLLAVTGTLGASAAGLNLLKRDLPVSDHLLEKHLTPTCRLDASRILAPMVNAMIDISDGLASEVNHICRQSDVGARIIEKEIPLHKDVIDAGKRLGLNPADLALNGGEDFELLFSIAPENLERLNSAGLEYHLVGTILESGKDRYLMTETGQEVPLTGGYKHFQE